MHVDASQAWHTTVGTNSGDAHQKLVAALFTPLHIRLGLSNLTYRNHCYTLVRRLAYGDLARLIQSRALLPTWTALDCYTGALLHNAITLSEHVNCRGQGFSTYVHPPA